MDDDALMRDFLARRADLIAYLRVIGPAGLAEDAFQETFLVVHRRLADFRRDGDFPAWVRGIARNVLRQLGRKGNRLQTMADEALTGLIDQAVAEHEAVNEPVDRLPALRRCVERLAEPQRRLLHLRYALGQPIEQIAVVLHRTPGAAQVALSRLRTVLGDCMARQGGAA